ncbi:MAG: hypothetical protein ACREKH_01335, partial [Candidatus Rokuibacteriota bacterium]
MAYTDTGRKAEAQGGGVGSLNVTLNSTVAGNFLALGSSVYQDETAVAVSDGVNGSYTQSFRVHVQFATAALHYVANNGGGNLTITSDPSGGAGTYDMSIYAHEFSGGPTSAPASGTPATNTGTGTTSSTTAMTPADNDVLLLAVDSHTTSGTVTENAGGDGFSLSNEHESGASAEPGSLV